MMDDVWKLLEHTFMGRESHNYGEVIAPLLAGIVAPSNGPFSRPMNDNVRRDIKAWRVSLISNDSIYTAFLLVNGSGIDELK